MPKLAASRHSRFRSSDGHEGSTYVSLNRTFGTLYLARILRPNVADVAPEDKTKHSACHAGSLSWQSNTPVRTGDNITLFAHTHSAYVQTKIVRHPPTCTPPRRDTCTLGKSSRPLSLGEPIRAKHKGCLQLFFQPTLKKRKILDGKCGGLFKKYAMRTSGRCSPAELFLRECSSQVCKINPCSPLHPSLLRSQCHVRSLWTL